MCVLHGRPACKSLNSLRCGKAEKGTPSKKLPPTDYSFEGHLLCIWGQLLIWKEALISIPVPPLLQHAGFQINTSLNCLEPIRMTLNAAAPELLNDLIFQCAPYCNEDCTWTIILQPCTAACDCKGNLIEDNEEICQNLYTHSALHGGDDDSDSE